MKSKFTLASSRNPKFSSYSDIDIQAQYAAAVSKYKEIVKAYDNNKATDDDLDAIDLIIFELDDELCARGL